MFDEILHKLKEYFVTNFQATNLVKLVKIMSNYEVQTSLQISQIPCIIISPNGERYIRSQVGNLYDQYFNIIVRIIARSTDMNKYRDPSYEKNIYKLSEKIRDKLVQNKTLDGLVTGIGEEYAIKDIDVLYNNTNGLFNCREISLSYYRFSTFVGNRNDQKNTQVPSGINPPVPEI